MQTELSLVRTDLSALVPAAAASSRGGSSVANSDSEEEDVRCITISDDAPSDPDVAAARRGRRAARGSRSRSRSP